jgi:hypothetical protein
MKGWDNLRDLGVDGKIILELIVKSAYVLGLAQYSA